MKLPRSLRLFVPVRLCIRRRSAILDTKHHQRQHKQRVPFSTLVFLNTFSRHFSSGKTSKGEKYAFKITTSRQLSNHNARTKFRIPMEISTLLHYFESI